MRTANRNIIPFIFLGGTAVLFYLTLRGPGDWPEEGKGKRYLELQQTKKEAIRKVELNYQQAEMHQQVAPAVRRGGEGRQVHALDLEPERNIGAEDSRTESLRQSQTLDQKMDGFIAHRQQYEAMEKIQKAEYVKEFIKEARSMGYEVQINEHLEIVKVTRIAPK